jgi:hypothetical protein
MSMFPKTNKKTKITLIFFIRQKCPYKFENKKIKLKRKYDNLKD